MKTYTSVSWEVHDYTPYVQFNIISWKTRSRAREDMRTLKALGRKDVKMYKVTRHFTEDGKFFAATGEQKR